MSVGLLLRMLSARTIGSIEKNYACGIVRFEAVPAVETHAATSALVKAAESSGQERWFRAFYIAAPIEGWIGQSAVILVANSASGISASVLLEKKVSNVSIFLAGIGSTP